MYRLGDWLVDPATRRISRGAEVARISPKAMQVLTVLGDAGGAVVSRDALLDEAWPDVTVGEEVLTHAIAELRKALGDSTRRPRYIETVHKSGYRLLVEPAPGAVSAGNADPAGPADDALRRDVPPETDRSAPGRVETAAAEAGEAPAVPHKPSIAVLPFGIIGGDPDQQFFANGLTEDLITDLSRISALFVIASPSTLSYKGQSPDPGSVARRLGVRYVLQGSIRKAGDRLRIAAQLIDAHNGVHVWGDRYDRVVADIFDLQDDITREIVTALRVQLTDGENALVWRRGTQNVDAWKLATQAVEAVLEYSAMGNLQARELVRRAVALDPGYALAWGILGITYWYDARLGGDDPETLMAEAEDCAAKGAAIDDANPWVVGLQAYILVSRGRYDAAVETARRGIARNPSAADLRGYLGYSLMNAGRPDEAIRAFDEAMRLNPLFPIWYRPLMARALDASGQPERAAEVARGALEIRPENFSSQLHLASLMGRAGNREEAASHVAGVLRRAPGFNLAQARLWLATRDGDFKARFLDGLRKAGLPE